MACYKSRSWSAAPWFGLTAFLLSRGEALAMERQWVVVVGVGWEWMVFFYVHFQGSWAVISGHPKSFLLMVPQNIAAYLAYSDLSHTLMQFCE